MEGFDIWLTIDGSENQYAAKLRSEYSGLRSVSWLGIMPRDRILLRYAKADCLLFPSKLETWGIPISEFQQTGKPMLVIDLPYAHETVGSYHAVSFFPEATPGSCGCHATLHPGATCIECNGHSIYCCAICGQLD